MSGIERARFFLSSSLRFWLLACGSLGGGSPPICDTDSSGDATRRASLVPPAPASLQGEHAGDRTVIALLHPLPHVLGFQGPRGDGSSRNPHAGPSGKKTKAPEVVDQPADRPREAPWAYFCDFRDITHVVLKERHVSIHCQDNKSLVGPGAGALAGAGGACGP